MTSTRTSLAQNPMQPTFWLWHLRPTSPVNPFSTELFGKGLEHFLSAGGNPAQPQADFNGNRCPLFPFPFVSGSRDLSGVPGPGSFLFGDRVLACFGFLFHGVSLFILIQNIDYLFGDHIAMRVFIHQQDRSKTAGPDAAHGIEGIAHYHRLFPLPPPPTAF